MLIYEFISTNLVDLFQTISILMTRNLLFLCLFLNSLVFAQDYRPCGTDEMVRKALENEPGLKELRKQYLEQADSIRLENFLSKASNEIHIIPVVVHIMHTGGNSNISDEQVFDALRIINEDFKKLNSDTSAVVDEFQSIAANVGVEFRLAKLDPDGNCTKGITRTYTTLTNDAGENVKAVVGWDPRMYLNIWVVSNIASGAGGYSYYPGSAPNADANAGIVIRSSQFGSIGASNGGNFSSRSLTHEIGHYLDLPHTWGSSNDNYLEENCDLDDYVDDTPNTIGSNLGCVLTQSTCGSLDNVQNYMDYSSCAKMYSEGQRTRMRTALETGYIWSNAARNNLPTEENLMLTGVHDDYTAPDCLATVEFESESSVTCSGMELMWENLSWNYDSALSFEWNFPGGSPASSTEENPTITYSETGLYDVSLTVITTGGANTKTIENAVYVQNQSDMLIAPSSISFSNSDFPFHTNPTYQWYVDNTLEGDSWHWNSASSTSSEGSMRVRSVDFVEPGIRRAYSPLFDLSDVSVPCYMYYDYAYARKNTESEDELKVKISGDCGYTLTNRLTKNTDNLTTVSTNYFFDFTPNSTQWEEQKINLNAWAGDQNVQAVFEFNGTNGNYLYIDNIRFGVPNLNIDEFTANNLNLEIFPNPNNGNAQLSFNLLNPFTIEIRLVDVLGNELSVNQHNLKSGLHSIDLQSLKEDIKPGMYFLHFSLGSYTQTKQVLIL